MAYSSRSSLLFSEERVRFMMLIAFFVGLFFLVLWKLFQLQVVQGEELQEKAYNIRNASVSISARRGGIFLQDTKTGNVAPVALNTTLYTVFFDARSGVDKNGNAYGVAEEDFPLVAKSLTNILYTEKRFAECEEDIKKCPEGSVFSVTGEDEDDIILEKAPSYVKAKEAFEKNLLAEFVQKREKIIWVTEVEESILRSIEAMAIPHLYVSIEKGEVYIDLVNLTDVNRTRVAQALADVFGGDADSIASRLYSTRKGYIPVMSRVYPEELKKITALQKEYDVLYAQEYARYQKLQRLDGASVSPPKLSPFKGVGFEDDPVRYYPENDLAAQVIGFVDSDGVGQYGVERSLDRILKGEDGVLSTARDVRGNAVGISQENTGKVTDGANVILTIDRTLQNTVEKILDEKLKEYKADSAQVIIMDPNTGEVLVMANAPRFNPNFYGKVYERTQVEKEDVKNIYKTAPLERKDENGEYVSADFETFEKAANRGAYDEFYWFKNIFGPRVYINKTIMEIYEPGSVMKPLVVAAALAEGEITPFETFDEKEPRKVDSFTIRNADGRYLANQTPQQIIARSANVGMSYIADELGNSIMYDALKNFGFGEYTNLLLPEELDGEVKYYKDWSRARLFTASFGQGFSVTPLQLVRAWTSVASGGYVVEPRVVSQVQYADGTVEDTRIEKKRIFPHDVVEEMRDILVFSVESGVAGNARVANHYVAGKTGTSQIAGANGQYESIEGDEKGTTITSFIGFAPVDNPEFLVYVKFDRPRRGMRDLEVFGSTTAAPTFSEIMSFLFDYYSIPEDK